MCEEFVPLGMSSGAIPDENITASSYERHPAFDREPKFARLGLYGRHFSSAPEDPAPWIQADLGSKHRVSVLQTQGAYGDSYWQYWVEQVKVQVGFSEDNLRFINDSNNQPKVCKFIGQKSYVQGLFC